MKDEIKKNIDNKDNLSIENQENEKIKPSTDIADAVATIIIEKIISNVIINIKIKEAYTKTNEHLFNNLIKFINPYLKNNFIFHENGIEDVVYQKKQLNFCHEPIKKINTWSIIPEPSCSTKDRCENTKTKVIKYKKYTDLKSDGVRESSAALDAEEDKLIKSFNNNINENKSKSKRLNKLILISKDKENKQEKIVKNGPKQKIKISINNDFPKRKKEEVLELSMINDLPKESYENKYSLINSNDENKKLRLEREIQIEQKLHMEKLAKDREIQEKKIRQKLMLMKIGKEIDGNRLTFDSNGNIINLRSQNYENFQDGFVFSNLKINTKIKKKPILELKDVVYPVEGVEQIEDEEEKDKDKNEIKIENEKSRIKVEKYEEITRDKDDRYKKKKEKEKLSIIPSGVNFDTIKPEVGVIIYGENRKNIKEGGFDYVKKYNRYSLNELSKFISESSNMNSNNNFTSIINSKNDLDKNSKNSFNNDGINDYVKTEDNYVGYKEEFNDNNNPLILNAHHSNNNANNNFSEKFRYNSLNSLSINKSNLISKRKIKSFDKVKTENILEPIIGIKLNKNLKTKNLTNIFDETTLNTINNNTNEKKLENSLNANTLDNMNYFEKAVLPFKILKYKRRYNDMKISNTINIDNNNKEKEYYDKAFINKFNLNIMKNKEWGKNEDNYFKLQEQINSEMMGDEKQNQSIFRRQRNKYNRMKNLGMHIMTESNTRDRKEKKFPLFGGY